MEVNGCTQLVQLFLINAIHYESFHVLFSLISPWSYNVFSTCLFILVGCPFQSCVLYMPTHKIFCTFTVPFTGESLLVQPEEKELSQVHRLGS